MKVAIIGTGYVGLVTGTCLAEIGHRVICVDNNKDKINVLNSGGIPIYEPGLLELIKKNVAAKRLIFSTELPSAVKQSEVIFIAVGTPPRDDGSADLSYVENVARQVAQAMERYTVVVEKSTVPVETGEWVKRTIELYNKRGIPFDVVSNPEFLREGSAVKDFLEPDRIVVGVGSKKAEKIMRELYEPIKSELVVTDIKSAELIKHASNSFLATKISFINAVANVCEKTGADIKMVAHGMGLDSRIGPRFLNAGIGYGGSCFPKDVDAFIHISDNVGYDFRLLKEVQAINKLQREKFLRKVHDAMWIVKDKRIAIWGLSFKPNTDDMREAPSIDVINALQREGAKITAHCPGALETAKEHLKGVEMHKN
ncbi:UDP-glucose/GDP-mannose dehydrogenase family protein, partial [Candidatus Woesearchaeota archaeon]|nr:UDP-glucose/GDP-mannose dehydrogenase family protein [Candidatus Woesearchaeota archaeon]